MNTIKDIFERCDVQDPYNTGTPAVLIIPLQFLRNIRDNSLLQLQESKGIPETPLSFQKLCTSIPHWHNLLEFILNKDPLLPIW
ncbi:hypothetical protein TNCT_168461 [Trichonephila clavata]|uniref:Uncharacterized protein n=1 Tax=Trichonephila clavata TaxID=2740835 RepID=A0A8X6I1F1_TRICU|nr:hypothetical protein TNCT_168461 [Trichonephila clavata]